MEMQHETPDNSTSSSNVNSNGYNQHRDVKKLDDSFSGNEGNHMTDEDDDDDEYNYDNYNLLGSMTDDQSKATGELYNLKLDLGYTGKLNFELKFENILKPFHYQCIIVDSGKVDAYNHIRITGSKSLPALSYRISYMQIE